MKITSIVLLFSTVLFSGYAKDISGKLENSAVAWSWRVTDGKLRPLQMTDKLNGNAINLAGECFQLVLSNDVILKASDFKMDGRPTEESLKPEFDSSTPARHFAGKQLMARFSDPDKNLSAEWRVILRDGSTYVREELTLHATSADVLVKKIILLDETIPGAKTDGTVDGSPVVAGNFFFGYEHPMAQNTVEGGTVLCSYNRNAVLKSGEALTQSCVLGVAPAGQLRRGFLAYVERERAHPYRPFTHYNSWYDIAWDNRKYDEKESLNAMDQVGRELMQKRGVKLDSFLFDDGWDDGKTLWQFHNGFPNGFTPLKTDAAKYHAGIGVWISPFGGYGQAKMQRLQYASQLGFETNSSGFSLAGSKYFQRFHDIVMEMVQKYGVNMFKFDGLAAGGKSAANGLTRDGDAMLRLIADLRTVKPDIYISQTVGTWPSPFWLLYVDSTWRGGSDHSFYGKGSDCQQWITYRAMETYNNVVQRGPLYPLNSIMVHGIIYATNAENLTTMSDADFADQVHEFFGSGTQLQEMYITPVLLDKQNWDDLAEAAKWSRANSDVLVDTHWVGGDPARAEIYGYASWSPRKGILVLRNPDDKPANFTADIKNLFDLPANAPKEFVMHSPWKSQHDDSSITLTSGQPYTFALKPFEVLVLEEIK